MSDISVRKIGVVAPSCRLDTSVPDKVKSLAEARFGDRCPEIFFHEQCFASAGHFAGTDDARAAAFLEVANDPMIDAVWFARGGYGSGRLLSHVLPRLTDVALGKTYVGYSDIGNLLAALRGAGAPHLAHGPMPSDINRTGGDVAVVRALAWLVDRDETAVEPNIVGGESAAAFNLTVLSHLIGTPWQPDLAGCVLMIEDVDEHMYRIDRALWQVLSSPAMSGVAGVRLGRISQIPDNDPDFVLNEEETVKDRCAEAGVAYLGRADIGHDIDNKVVPWALA